jgi:hypothetical protein
MPPSGYLKLLPLTAFRWHDLLHFVAVMVFPLPATRGPWKPAEKLVVGKVVNSAVVKTWNCALWEREYWVAVAQFRLSIYGTNSFLILDSQTRSPFSIFLDRCKPFCSYFITPQS